MAPQLTIKVLLCLSLFLSPTFLEAKNLNKKPSTLLRLQNGKKFCFDDSYASGNKFELVLLDGGQARIVIKNSADKIIRTGTGTWSGKNDGPGGNPPYITLKLSTGILRFMVVVDQYTSSITMLIDSKENQWFACYN